MSLDSMFGWIFSPLAWLMGVEGADMRKVGERCWERRSCSMSSSPTSISAPSRRAGALAPKSLFLATFALCGFANFASIGIQLGGTGSLAPTQRPTIAALGFKAVLGGTLATLMTATLAGAFFTVAHIVP